MFGFGYLAELERNKKGGIAVPSQYFFYYCLPYPTFNIPILYLNYGGRFNLTKKILYL